MEGGRRGAGGVAGCGELFRPRLRDRCWLGKMAPEGETGRTRLVSRRGLLGTRVRVKLSLSLSFGGGWLRIVCVVGVFFLVELVKIGVVPFGNGYIFANSLSFEFGQVGWRRSTILRCEDYAANWLCFMEMEDPCRGLEAEQVMPREMYL